MTPGPIVMFGTKWPSMTSRGSKSACCSTLAISSASFAKSADNNDGAILIMRCRRLLHDRGRFLPADHDCDWIAGAHRRTAKRELTNDYAIADSRICLEFHR